MTTFVAPPRSKIALAMREPNLLLPRKRPISRVAVDCNKSITNGLVGAWLLGPNCYDLVTGRHVTDNSVTFVTDDIGISSRVARGASAYIDTGFTASELGIGGSSSRTIIVAGQIDDDANASKPIFSMGSATSNADFTLLQTGWDTPSAYYKLELWGENIDVASSGWPARDVPNIWAVTYDQTSTYLRFYIWGALVGERTATAINTNDTYTLSFGRHANRGEEFGGRFYVAYAFNRALSDEEIREISRRWFIPLMPANQSPFLVSVPAVGGVPTLSSPGVTGVQATQATPQVTLTF